MPCDRCGGEHFTKAGQDRQSRQLYRCRACGRRMTERSGSAFSGYRFPDEVIALAVRWYLRFRLSYADVVELLAERGIEVDASTVYDWVRAHARRRLMHIHLRKRVKEGECGSPKQMIERHAQIIGSHLGR